MRFIILLIYLAVVIGACFGIGIPLADYYAGPDWAQHISEPGGRSGPLIIVGSALVAHVLFVFVGPR